MPNELNPVMNADETSVSAVASLAEPTRRHLYEVVAGSPDPLSKDQAAQLAGVPTHTAKFHLDKLVEEGLLDVEFHKLTGREGPGSGRPSKCYRRADNEIAVSLPARQYDLLSRILANAVAKATASGDPVADVAAGIAKSEGETFGRLSRARAADQLTTVGAVLAETGYEPYRSSLGHLELRNCPFHKAAAEQTELVCGLNLEFVEGVCAGLEATSVQAALEPAPNRCCVTVNSRTV